MKKNNGTFGSGLLATRDLLRPYERRAMLLAVGISLTAIVDALGIGLIFPMFVSLLQDGHSESVRGLAGGFLAGISETFPHYSTSSILVCLFLAVTCLQAALHIVIRRTTARFQWRARHDWATTMMDAYLAEDRARLSERQLGDQLEKMFAQTRQASTCLCQMIQFTACLLNLVVLYMLVSLIHWQLAAAFLLGTVVLFCATRPLWSKYAVGLGSKQVASNRKSYSIALENLMAARDIKAFGIERDRIGLFARELDEAHKAAERQTVVQSLADPLGLLLLSASIILVVITSRWAFPEQPGLVVPLVGFGLMAVRRLQTLTLGLASHLFAVAGLLPSVSLVRQELAELGFVPKREPMALATVPKAPKSVPVMPAASAVGSEDRRVEVLGQSLGMQHRRDFPVEERNGVVLAPDHFGAQDVVVKNLCFAYAGNSRLLDNASFKIPLGVTLLVGPSGQGKSTLAELLMGNLTRGSGEIRWGHTDIGELMPAEWRRRVGYVGQESYLFNTSVRENLLIARRSASDANLRDACRMARAWSFIEELPEGLDTVVGERGLTLSAGQRQRLMIARALVRDPPLLIFDEATNSLDPPNTLLVWQAIDALRFRKTILVITHQFDTTFQPDVVLCLRDRQITTVDSLNALSDMDSIIESPQAEQHCA